MVVFLCIMMLIIKNSLCPYQLNAERSSCLNQCTFLLSALCFCNDIITSLQALHSGWANQTLYSAYIIHVQIRLTQEPCVLCDLSGGQSHLYSFGWDCRRFEWSIIPTWGPSRTPICCSHYSFTFSVHCCNIHNSDNRGMSLGSEPPAGFY